MLWLALVGCGDGYPPPDELPAEYTACQSAGDCMVVELRCCDSCQGGVAVAVNQEAFEEVTDRYGESCRPDTTCADEACQEGWVPLCEDGTCAATHDLPTSIGG